MSNQLIAKTKSKTWETGRFSPVSSASFSKGKLYTFGESIAPPQVKAGMKQRIPQILAIEGFAIGIRDWKNR
jgi:hypothetical protein